MENPALMMQTSAPVLPAALRRTMPATPAVLARDSRDARLLARASTPARLTDHAATAWAAVAQPLEVTVGAHVVTREAQAGALWLVARGRVALGMLGEDGQLQHRRTVEAGEWLDVSSALLGGAYLEDAVVEQDGEVWQFPWDEVQRVGQAHPSVFAAVATVAATQVQGLIEGTRSLVMKDVQARCASFLLEQDEHDGGLGSLRLTQRKRAIAQQLGTTAETFSRTLRQLTRRGLIEVRGYTILLLDREGLRAVAEPVRRAEGLDSLPRAAPADIEPSAIAIEA